MRPTFLSPHFHSAALVSSISLLSSLYPSRLLLVPCLPVSSWKPVALTCASHVWHSTVPLLLLIVFPHISERPSTLADCNLAADNAARDGDHCDLVPDGSVLSDHTRACVWEEHRVLIFQTLIQQYQEQEHSSEQNSPPACQSTVWSWICSEHSCMFFQLTLFFISVCGTVTKGVFSYHRTLKVIWHGRWNVSYVHCVYSKYSSGKEHIENVWMFQKVTWR